MIGPTTAVQPEGDAEGSLETDDVGRNAPDRASARQYCSAMSYWAHRWNWRMALVRFATDTLIVLIVVLVTPGLSVPPEGSWLDALYLGLLYALISVLVRPVLTLLLLPMVVSTYGGVMLLVYVIEFGLLAWFSGLIEVASVFAVLLGGVVLAVVTWALEGLMGLTPPVVPDEPAAARSGVVEP